ncbi:13392_t:CDS:1, partial [Cetraspora pellucida]
SFHLSIYLYSVMNKTINTIDNNSETILNTDFLNELLNNESYEPDIKTVEFDIECNDESTAESGGWNSDEDISLIEPSQLHTEMTFPL